MSPASPPCCTATVPWRAGTTPRPGLIWRSTSAATDRWASGRRLPVPAQVAGGPGTPGVLVLRRDLARNRVPTVPGGGTISRVHGEEQFYVDDVEYREEGTPAIVESIRAGLAFQLKEAVGADIITEIEGTTPGGRSRPGVPTRPLRFSATRRPTGSRSCRSPCAEPAGRRLHHGFVVALLNDLFGIQCRGGCSCAGPYGHRLLDIGIERARDFAGRAVEGWLGIEPGWTRVSFATTSPSRRSASSSRRCTSSPRTANGCSRRTGSTPLGSLEPSRRAASAPVRLGFTYHPDGRIEPHSGAPSGSASTCSASTCPWPDDADRGGRPRTGGGGPDGRSGRPAPVRPAPRLRLRLIPSFLAPIMTYGS